MQSALIAIMIEAGWHLGHPLAVVVEEVNQHRVFLVNAWVGYIIQADHSQVVFKDKQHEVRQEVLLPATKELHMHGRKEWEIPLLGRQTMYIGQSISFIRRVGFWAADLHAHQALGAAQVVGRA
jgi:hypothetical protein